MRTGRGTTGLRNRGKEKGILEAHQARHGGLSANWWEHCKNSRRKRSEYIEMQKPFLCRILNKKILLDPLPWGSEAMAIKTSLLIPHVGWLPQNLNPKISETVAKWKTQATKFWKFLCLSCRNPNFSTALHFTFTSYSYIHIYIFIYAFDIYH